jgi:hypothetical protein
VLLGAAFAILGFILASAGLIALDPPSRSIRDEERNGDAPLPPADPDPQPPLHRKTQSMYQSGTTRPRTAMLRPAPNGGSLLDLAGQPAPPRQRMRRYS